MTQSSPSVEDQYALVTMKFRGKELAFAMRPEDMGTRLSGAISCLKEAVIDGKDFSDGDVN